MDLRKMPSRRWYRDAQRKSNKGYSTPDDNRGRGSEDEERMMIIPRLGVVRRQACAVITLTNY